MKWPLPFSGKSSRIFEVEGFTTIELVVTIAVMAIMLGVAVPNYMDWRKNMLLNSAAQDVYSLFQRAKLEAAKRNTYCTVAFNRNISGQVRDIAAYIDTNTDLVYDAGEEVVYTIMLSDYSGVSFDPAKGGGDGLTFQNPNDAIAFASNGLPRTNVLGSLAGGTVSLINDTGRMRDVTISNAGNIRIQ